LKERLTEYELKAKDVELHYEKTLMSHDQRMKELEKEIQRLQINTSKLEEEKK
jgi:hypothetical protein